MHGMQLGVSPILTTHGTHLGVSPVLRTQLGIRSVLRTQWTQGTQKRHRLSLDATPAHLTQDLFLLMYHPPADRQDGKSMCLDTCPLAGSAFLSIRILSCSI